MDRSRSESRDYSLLPGDRTFRDLLPAFLLPYLAYVALGGLLPGLIGPDLTQAVRFLAVGGLLLLFRRNYSLGPGLTPVQCLIALAGAAAAAALWIASLRFCLSLPLWSAKLEAAEGAEFSLLYAALRTLNSVLLVPVFEELFARAYVQEIAHPGPGSGQEGAGGVRGPGGLLDRKPRPLPRPPLSARAAAAAAAVFALGHDPASLLPAVLYYLLTTAIYAYTRSFRTVVAVHALTNLAIAAAVWSRPDMRFLWF